MTETFSIGSAATARGKFITFEGGEGVGKSTQITHLSRRLDEAGVTHRVTREPGGTPFAEEARRILLDPIFTPKTSFAQAMLFYAARSDHLDQLIRPVLSRGHWVLCDRFADSTRAYQGAAGGVQWEVLDTFDALVIGATMPDLTILLDLDPKVGLARANERRAASSPGAFLRADTFEGRQLEFHQRLRDGFLEGARVHPHRVLVFDAFQNEIALAEQIWSQVALRFNLTK